MRDRMIRVFIVLVCLVAAIVIFLQNGFLRQGGVVVAPLLFCSLLGYAVLFSKAGQFFRIRMDAGLLIKQIFEKLERQRFKEAIDICGQAGTPLGRVLRSGIMKYDHGREDIKEAMDQAARYEWPPLEEGLPFLAVLLDILPLLGFLGTFMGIADIFHNLQVREAIGVSARLLDVAAGVWQMVLPPLLALVALIPLLVGYRFLKTRIGAVEEDIDLASRDLLVFLMERRMSS